MSSSIGYAPDGTCVDFSKIVAVAPVYRVASKSSFFIQFYFDIHFLATEVPFQKDTITKVSIESKYEICCVSYNVDNVCPFESQNDSDLFHKQLKNAEDDWNTKRTDFIAQLETYKASVEK